MSDKQELALLGGANNVSQISQAISERLMKLCAEAGSKDEAVQAIARAGLLHEAQRAAADCRRLAAGFDDDIQIVKTLEPLVLIYGTPSLGASAVGQEVKTQWWSVYFKALRRVPKEALEAAVSDYIEGRLPADPKTGRVPQPRHLFPDPALLIQMASARANEVRSVAWRIQCAAELKDTKDRKPGPKETKEVGAKLHALRQELDAAKPRAVPDAPALSKSRPGEGLSPLARSLVVQGYRSRP